MIEVLRVDPGYGRPCVEWREYRDGEDLRARVTPAAVVLFAPFVEETIAKTAIAGVEFYHAAPNVEPIVHLRLRDGGTRLVVFHTEGPDHARDLRDCLRGPYAEEATT